MVELDALIGETLDARYRVERKLGQGGMGAVFLATHTPTRLPVALKVVLPQSGRPRMTPRFLREARLAARLRHPNVVEVYDFGRWGEPEYPRYFLAMELVEGVSLGLLLERGAPLPLIAGLLGQVLEGLAHVHARDVVHRDIKPDNILVERLPDGSLRAKLTDFGLASALASDEPLTRLTEAGSIIGTPAYMAPEQFEGHAAGPPSDLYPVGVMLYHAACGQLPHSGTLHQLLASKLSDGLPPINDPRGQPLDPALEQLIATLLARRPEDRYPLAADVLARLEPFAEHPRLDDDAWAELLERAAQRDSTVPWTHALDGRDTLSMRSHPEQLRRRDIQAEQPLWGRGDEIEALEDLASAVEGGLGQVVLISGDPGLGKSTLMQRVGVQWHEAGRFIRLGAACRPEGGIIGALGRAFDHMLGTVGRARGPVEDAARAFLAHVGEQDEDEVQALVNLLRPELAAPAVEAAVARQQKFALVVRLLRRIARDRPVLLILDDLHVAGADAAAFLDVVLSEIGFAPFSCLVLAAYRPHLSLEQALISRQTSEHRHRLALEPLSVSLLSDAIADAHDIGFELAAHVARRSGGNPLFALELARALAGADSSVSRSRLSHTTLSDSLLPETLRELLESSLEERLGQTPRPERARSLVERIAILGERVDAELLERYLGDDTDLDALDDDLDALIQAGVLRDAGFDEVAFSNGLLRDTLLATLGPRKARRLHLRAARLRERRGHKADAGLIGDHLAEAGRAEDAVDWWIAAQRHEALSGNALRSASYGQRALDALDAADPRGTQVALGLGRILRALGGMESALSVLEPVLDAPSADDAMCAGELVGEIHHELSQNSAWQVLLEKLEARLDEVGPKGRSAFLRARAFYRNMHEDAAAARLDAEEALALTPTGEEAVRAAARLTWAGVHMGDNALALDAAERALEAAGERADLRAEALRLLTIIHAQRRDFKAMLEASRAALDLQRKLGRYARVVTFLNDLVMHLLVADEAEEALERSEEALRLANEMNLVMEYGRATIMLCISELMLGRAEKALARLSGEFTFWRSHFGALYEMCLGWAYLLCEDIGQALDVLEGIERSFGAASSLRPFTVLLDALCDDLIERRHADPRIPAIADSFVRASLKRWRLLGEAKGIASSEARLALLRGGGEEAPEPDTARVT